MSAPESWKAAYRELIGTLVRMGYPEELGKAIAKNLGSEKTMRRMTAYLHSARPRSAEEIVERPGTLDPEERGRRGQCQI